MESQQRSFQHDGDMVRNVFLDSNLKWIKFEEILFIIVRDLAVVITWERSHKGLNFPVCLCVKKQKEMKRGRSDEKECGKERSSFCLFVI